MITENYEDHTKEELLSEINSRNIEGITMATSKPDMVAALELSDEPKQPQSPKSTVVKSGLPKGNEVPVVPRDPGSAPDDSEYSGLYTKDGEDFALAIVEDSPSGKTHFAKNTVHFWNGTPEEFKLQFEKK